MSDDYDRAKDEGKFDEKTGLPIQEPADVEAAKGKMAFMPFIFIILTFGIGTAIAWAVFAFGDTTKYQARIDLAKEYDGQWLMLALAIFQATLVWMNMYPMRYKAGIMSGKAGNLRANMFIYKLATDQAEEGSAVVMHSEGDLGRYNRANRSIYHYLENSLGIIASLPLSFFLFPLPTFVTLCAFCLGRIVYQLGYTAKGYGGHGPGFLLDRLATMTVSGLMIVAYYKTF